MSRVYDDPNHERYGPVRRCWVILAGMCPDLTLLDQEYRSAWGWDWDEHVVYYLTHGGSEAAALRAVVGRAIDIYPE